MVVQVLLVSKPMCGAFLSQVQEKLQRVRFQGCSKLLISAGTSKPKSQPAELRAARQALNHLLPHAITVLQGFTMSTSFAAELQLTAAASGQPRRLSLLDFHWPSRARAAGAAVAAQLPPLKQLGLAEPLDAAVLEQLGFCVSAADELCVREINTTPAGAVPQRERWPWPVVRVSECVQVEEWLPLARAMGAGVSWQLGDLQIELTADQVRPPPLYSSIA